MPDLDRLEQFLIVLALASVANLLIFFKVDANTANHELISNIISGLLGALVGSRSRVGP